MDNDELTEQEKREMELILYSLDKIAPFFKDDNVTDIWIDNGIVSIKKFGIHLMMFKKKNIKKKYLIIIVLMDFHFSQRINILEIMNLKN